MLEALASHFESAAALAPHWGFALVFFFMAVESSFIPFPSEIVMIPAGFLAFRGELTLSSPWPDAALALLFGTLGSLAGAYVNYWLGLRLGRPFLHRHARWFFLTEEKLDRAEGVFREYGDVATFVCRLLPAIRQLVSIPAGLARMPLGRFTFFTALGAGFWNLVLLSAGAALGHGTRDLSYLELVLEGKRLVAAHGAWIAAVAAAALAVWALARRVGRRRSSPVPPSSPPQQ